MPYFLNAVLLALGAAAPTTAVVYERIATFLAPACWATYGSQGPAHVKHVYEPRWPKRFGPFVHSGLMFHPNVGTPFWAR